jgi:hypothetical protein
MSDINLIFKKKKKKQSTCAIEKGSICQEKGDTQQEFFSCRPSSPKYATLEDRQNEFWLNNFASQMEEDVIDRRTQFILLY